MKTYEPEIEWLREWYPFFRHPEANGVYVDLGASHPINKSLTAYLRDSGWRGLAIDGNSDYAKDWYIAGYFGHFICSILSDQPTARFAIHDNSFTSRIAGVGEEQPEKWGINRIIEEKVQPLNDILAAREIGEIDLLCIDLEGYEYAVLKTLDFEKHQPKFIISEYATEGTGIDPSVCNFLLGLGYEVIHMTHSNLIYRRK